jgi:hydrogenase maturation factor
VNGTSGRIVEIYLDGGIAKAKVATGSADVHVPLMLLMDARVGDHIVIQSGLAISKVEIAQVA